MSLGKVPVEGMQHICKNCGHTGQPKNAEIHGTMDALNLGAGISTRTTVECPNCNDWNWHVAPSGVGSSASGKPTGLARAKRPAAPDYFNDRRSAKPTAPAKSPPPPPGWK